MEFDSSLFFDALTSQEFVNGALLTIALSLSSMAAAIVFGLVIALARGSRIGPVRWLAATYTWFFRAVPTLLQLLFVWNALPQLFPALKEDWFTPFLAGFVALAFNEAAYMAEITRGGLLSVDPGQSLAARALGLRPWQTLRRVVLPQAIRVGIPPTMNEFITLLKLTSLTSVISLSELLTVTNQQVSATFRFAEFYAAATVWYLAIVSVLMIFQARLERRYTWTSTARAGGFARVRARWRPATQRSL
jgi:polar amino acid transport system permease protein